MATIVGSLFCLRPEDIGNQARVLLVEFIRQRMISDGLQTAVEEDLLISPDAERGCTIMNYFLCIINIALVRLELSSMCHLVLCEPINLQANAIFLMWFICIVLLFRHCA